MRAQALVAASPSHSSQPVHIAHVAENGPLPSPLLGTGPTLGGGYSDHMGPHMLKHSVSQKVFGM